ncbi:MAG: hypothetical protein R2831_01475 [Chitinophagaceae bacterium]
MLRLLSYFFFFCSSLSSIAQIKTCDMPQASQFDFWIGEWKVYKNGTDTLVGFNTIKKVAGCALQENWRSVQSNSIGTSLNKFNAANNLWQQFWVDNNGNTLELAGYYKDNKMILLYEPKANVRQNYHRITWFQINDSTVRQLWETKYNTTDEWSVAFDGLYKKIKPKTNTITGIGGIFFKSKNPKELKAWYQKHFHIDTDQFGFMFESYDINHPQKKVYTQWSPFSSTTNYFEPSTKEFMINYRVENLDDVISELKNHGVSFIDEMESYEYGKFIHLLDPEGNKIELWEPIEMPTK